MFAFKKLNEFIIIVIIYTFIFKQYKCIINIVLFSTLVNLPCAPVFENKVFSVKSVDYEKSVVLKSINLNKKLTLEEIADEVFGITDSN